NLSEGMVAVKIRPRLRLIVVGSPEYFRRRSVPKTPRQLAEHVCIQNMYQAAPSILGSLSEKAKRLHSIQPAPLRSTIMNSWCKWLYLEQRLPMFGRSGHGTRSGMGR